jgi:hypothetical protein
MSFEPLVRPFGYPDVTNVQKTLLPESSKMPTELLLECISITAYVLSYHPQRCLLIVFSSATTVSTINVEGLNTTTSYLLKKIGAEGRWFCRKRLLRTGRDRARPYEDPLPGQRYCTGRRAGLCAGHEWNWNHQQGVIAICVLPCFLKKSPSRGCPKAGPSGPGSFTP